MKKLVLFNLSFILMTIVVAQDEKEEPKFGINFSGFVKNDVFFDTRQTVASREGHFLLWPAAEALDINGDDINAKTNLNILAIQTRLTGKITGPDAFGAKTSGVIEGAFFGHSNTDVNGFRLRHAFGKLRWTNTELLFGQTWHPMFVPGCFPGVVSFNTGAPFQPFSRNPQVRLTQYFGDISLMAAVLSQRDFTSAGGSTILRNSSIPDMQVQLSYSSKDAEGGKEFLAGVGGGYKVYVPRLVTDSLIAVNESFGSFSTLAFLKYKAGKITIKFEGSYGQNTYDMLGISSYGIKSVDAATDEREYIPTSSMSVWTDIHTNTTKVQMGLFAGYTKNLGAGEDISGIAGSRSNIESVYRIAPRVIFNSGKMRFATEMEYTAAAFGAVDTDGTVINTAEVGNLRLLLAGYYFF